MVREDKEGEGKIGRGEQEEDARQEEAARGKKHGGKLMQTRGKNSEEKMKKTY